MAPGAPRDHSNEDDMSQYLRPDTGRTHDACATAAQDAGYLKGTSLLIRCAAAGCLRRGGSTRVKANH